MARTDAVGVAYGDGRDGHAVTARLDWDALRDVLATEWWDGCIERDPIAAGLAAMLLHGTAADCSIDDGLSRARRAMRFAHEARTASADDLSTLGDAIVASYFTAKSIAAETRSGDWRANLPLAAALRRKMDALHGRA